VPSLRVVLGPGLALASWSLYLGDAKATAGTVGGPAGPVPVGVATRVEGVELVMDALLFHGANPEPVRVQCRGAVNDPETLAQKTLDALNR
jgi:hypothetical protein